MSGFEPLQADSAQLPLRSNVDRFFDAITLIRDDQLMALVTLMLVALIAGYDMLHAAAHRSNRL